MTQKPDNDSKIFARWNQKWIQLQENDAIFRLEESHLNRSSSGQSGHETLATKKKKSEPKQAACVERAYLQRSWQR